MRSRPLSIMMLGLRGFPDVQGGIETHAEHLSPLLSRLGCDVRVIVRARYVAPNRTEWKGVRYCRLWAPKCRWLEAIAHTFMGVLLAAIERPDVLHIHAIGPALMTPLARLLGLRVIVTHHGPDYDREKWGTFARWVLRIGEAWGMLFANGRIAISQTIRSLIRDKYGVDSSLVANGVDLPEVPVTRAALDRFALKADKYVLMVSRLVPEKRHQDLIEAFSQAALPDWKLVLVGASDHPDHYAQEVLRAASTAPNIVATGFLTGLALRELFAHAGIFVLPSSHEGLPIALLEALSYGLRVIASDIPANRELNLAEGQYFPMGDVEMLASRIVQFACSCATTGEKQHIRQRVVRKYDWNAAAIETLAVYQQASRRRDGWKPVRAAIDRRGHTA